MVHTATERRLLIPVRGSKVAANSMDCASNSVGCMKIENKGPGATARSRRRNVGTEAYCVDSSDEVRVWNAARIAVSGAEDLGKSLRNRLSETRIRVYKWGKDRGY